MTTYLQRSDWTKHGPAHALVQLNPAIVKGFAVHWPGTTAPIGAASATSIARRLESYRVMHTSPGGIGTVNGGSDIAYQIAIDQEGRVWPLRGVIWKSGANGSAEANSAYGAVLLLLGPGEEPSRQMIQATQDYREDVWLRHFPKATKVVGHRDLYGTDCPGPAAYALVESGLFTHLPSTPRRPTKTTLVVDGKLGRATATRLQQVLNELGAKPKLVVDGDLGPASWKAVDMWLKVATPNGTPGRDTIRALQRKVGATADGILGPLTVRALQGWLNKQP